MAQQNTGQSSYNEAAMEEFQRMFSAAIEHAEKNSLPIAMIEGRCRDYLGFVEAFRLHGPLLALWQQKGVQSIILPNIPNHRKP